MITRYWHQRANKRLGNPPHGNREPLVAKDEVEGLQVELKVIKSIECDTLPSVLEHCSLGKMTGCIHRPDNLHVSQLTVLEHQKSAPQTTRQ